MKLIEADKVEQAIKDYWKAQVGKLPIPKSIEEHDEHVNRLDAILEHNDGLLKAIDELPSAEPDTTTHDSIPAETGKNDGDGTSGDCISRQQAIDALKELTANGTNKGMVFGEDAVHRIEILPSVQPEQRWIPCSERLPEKEGWYITTVESEKTGKRRIENDLFAVDIALAHGHTPNKFCKDGYRQRTVAWMPFPKPYQEEGEQDG